MDASRVAIAMLSLLIYLYIFRVLMLTGITTFVLTSDADVKKNYLLVLPLQAYSILSFMGSLKALNGMKAVSSSSLWWILIDNGFSMLLSLIATITALIAITSGRSTNTNDISIFLMSMTLTVIHGYNLMVFSLAFCAIATEEEKGDFGQQRTSTEYSECIASKPYEVNDGYLCPNDIKTPIYSQLSDPY